MREIDRLSASEGLRPPGLFFGEPTRRLESSGICVTESVYRGGAVLPQHAHQLAFFCLCIGGAYDEKYLYHSNSFEPFSIVYHPPGENHSCDMRYGAVRVLNIELSDQVLDQFGALAGAPDNCAQGPGGELVWLAVRVLAEFRAPDSCSAISIEHLVLEMLLKASRASTRLGGAPPRWFSRIVERLHDERDAAPGVSELAAEAGVHPVHLARVFRRYTGTTVGEYLRRFRLARACEQLIASGGRIADIALDAGFADQSHMTRALKRATGATPDSFRKMLK